MQPLQGKHRVNTKPGMRDQKISMLEAIKLFTIGGAYATNEEAKKGTISRGKLADMTVYSKNLFELERPRRIARNKH